MKLYGRLSALASDLSASGIDFAPPINKKLFTLFWINVFKQQRSNLMSLSKRIL